MGYTEEFRILMKSIKETGDRLNYFKRELLKVLSDAEKKEAVLSKSIEAYFNGINSVIYGDGLEKGKLGTIGEIRTWKDGKKYKKMPNGKWVRVYQQHDKHAEISIARLKGRVRNAKTTDELLEIVMNNIHRFEDENGRILPIAEELKKEVAASKGKINAEKKHVQNYRKPDEKNVNSKNMSDTEDVYDLRASEENKGFFEILKNGKVIKIANEKGIKKYLSDYGIKINGENTTAIITDRIKDKSKITKKEPEKTGKLIENLSVWNDRIYLNGKGLNGTRIYLVEAADGGIEPKYTHSEGSTDSYAMLLFSNNAIYNELEEYQPGITKMKFSDLMGKLKKESETKNKGDKILITNGIVYYPDRKEYVTRIIQNGNNYDIPEKVEFIKNRSGVKDFDYAAYNSDEWNKIKNSAKNGKVEKFGEPDEVTSIDSIGGYDNKRHENRIKNKIFELQKTKEELELEQKEKKNKQNEEEKKLDEKQRAIQAAIKLMPESLFNSLVEEVKTLASRPYASAERIKKERFKNEFNSDLIRIANENKLSTRSIYFKLIDDFFKEKNK